MYLSNLSDQACQCVLQANPENLSGSRSVLLTSNSKLFPRYYNTSSAIREKAHFLRPETLKGSQILFSKGKNRQIEFCSGWYVKSPSKKFCKSKCTETVQKKSASVGSSVFSHGTISRLIDHRRARCSWTVLALKMWLR